MKPLTPFLRLIWRNFFAILCWAIWLLLHFSATILSQHYDTAGLISLSLILFAAMIGCIFAVNRHADTLAELLSEPFGTLVLTLAVALIEVSLMLMVMFSGQENPTMLRDTVYATLMIMLNGMIGLSLISGGYRHFEQTFNLRGALSFLHLIAPLSMLLLIMPNRTLTSEGPSLNAAQEIFLGGLCVVVYLIFLLMQTTRHKALFDHHDEHRAGHDIQLQSGQQSRHRAISLAAAALLIAVLPIVLLAEYLGDFLNHGIEKLGAPTELAGIMIASLVLAPEGLSAFKAAVANRMQRAVNICLGSALSTIALTVPCMLLVAGWHDVKLALGLPGSGTTLLNATLITTLITLISGRTTLLQGNVHLMLFLAYLLMIFYP